jgi:hypothetical protein
MKTVEAVYILQSIPELVGLNSVKLVLKILKLLANFIDNARIELQVDLILSMT